MKAVGRPQKWTKMWRSGRKSVGARYIDRWLKEKNDEYIKMVLPYWTPSKAVDVMTLRRDPLGKPAATLQIFQTPDPSTPQDPVRWWGFLMLLVHFHRFNLT